MPKVTGFPELHPDVEIERRRRRRRSRSRSRDSLVPVRPGEEHSPGLLPSSIPPGSFVRRAGWTQIRTKLRNPNPT
jgi:hypothetical protein